MKHRDGETNGEREGGMYDPTTSFSVHTIFSWIDRTPQRALSANAARVEIEPPSVRTGKLTEFALLELTLN